jgi:hypothetical protein
VLDPDYVPPQRSTDNAHAHDGANGGAWQQFLRGGWTDGARSADGGRWARPEDSGGSVGSGMLVSEVGRMASRLAVAELPDSAGLCLGEAEELLFARDRLDSAIAARVGRVHAAGEARSGGHASTGTWLRASAGLTVGGASALVRLAVQLARLPLVRDRFASGTLAGGSVEAICQVTTRLSDAQAGLAEPILVELADHASPAEILKAGRYLRELLDPGTLDDDADDDYATRFLLTRPSSTGGVEGEFRLPREAGARLREFLTAYARPKGKDDDRPLRVRQADALAALLGKKVTTELLVLVRAESLPSDHPTTGHPTTGHPTHDTDSTHAASTVASDTPATGAPPSQSTPGRADTAATDTADSNTADTDTAAADTAHPGTAAADTAHAGTANADTADPGTADAGTAGCSDARSGTPQAGDGSTCRTGGPCHTEGTGSAGASAGSADADSASPGNAGTGARPAEDACGTCGHVPDRLAPGLLIATGQLLPISDVHRLARTSKLVRMVVDAQGQILDMGRAVRLATPAQRQAILARYTTCYRHGCPIPADMSEIDHVTGWADGGTTDLDQLAPACSWHNRDKATHPDRYHTRRNHDGTWTLLHHGKRAASPDECGAEPDRTGSEPDRQERATHPGRKPSATAQRADSPF